MANGEITIGDIRDLEATFVERLSTLNIFESKLTYENTTSANFYQIDEAAFGKKLLGAANLRKRSYSSHNIENDSHTLALVMRLRQGKHALDVAESKHLFVASNKLLASTAREFIKKEGDKPWHYIPPMLTTGQISTVAWLTQGKELEESRISKELLANCYSAVQPDQEWMPRFFEALHRFSQDNPEQIAKYAESAVFLRTARRIAQDNSFSSEPILRRLNGLDIFTRAIEAAEAKGAEVARELEEHQATLLRDVDQRAEAIRAEALQAGEALAEAQFNARVRRKAEKWANVVVTFLKILVLCLFAGSLLVDQGVLSASASSFVVGVQVTLFVVTVAAAMDLLKLQVWLRPFERLRKNLTEAVVTLLKND